MLMAWCWASSIWSPLEEKRGVTRFLGQHAVLHQAEVGEPGFELRRRAQAEELTQCGGIVIARTLVREHGIVAHRHAHKVVAPGGGEHNGEGLDGGVIGGGMSGIADVHPPGKSRERA